MEQPDSVVEGLRNLSEAFKVYDRALFYYDDAFNEALGVDADVDVKKNYKDILAQIPNEIGSGTSESAISDLLGARTLEVYGEALGAIVVTCEYIFDVRARLLKKHTSGWESHVDRDPEYAAIITRLHLGRAFDLVEELGRKFSANKEKNTWCAYTIEFELLEGMSRLVFDEIDFLKKRTCDIEQAVHRRQNEQFARRSIWLAIAAILVGSIVTWACSGDEDEISKHNIPLALADINNQTLAISNQFVRLVNLTDDLARNQRIQSGELLESLTYIKRSLGEAGSANSVATKYALELLDRVLSNLISNMTSPPGQDSYSEEERLVHQSLLEEVKALKESVTTLKAAVEAMKPSEITIKNDDRSRHKSGFFNWF